MKNTERVKKLTPFILGLKNGLALCVTLITQYKYYLVLLDGKFCNFTEFGQCTNCSGVNGIQTRSRNCSCPAPVNGGANCTASGANNTQISWPSGIQVETETKNCSTCPLGM